MKIFCETGGSMTLWYGVCPDLHWLPVHLRIDFKILCFAFRCYDKSAPLYLQDTVQSYSPQRTLRSSNPFSKTPISERAFYKSAPLLWNQSPSFIKNDTTIESFKKQLKTHLFKSYFD